MFSKGRIANDFIAPATILPGRIDFLKMNSTDKIKTAIAEKINITFLLFCLGRVFNFPRIFSGLGTTNLDWIMQTLQWFFYIFEFKNDLWK
jgi:hypothetical protein